MFSKQLGSIGLLLAITAVAGCGPTPPKLTPVSGVITLRGKPLPHASVQFIPLIKGFGGEYIADAVTDANGKYELRCTMGAGGCAGPNLVVVFEGPLPDDARGASSEAQMKATNFMNSLGNRPIPANFGTAAQSPLRSTVTLAQSQYDIDLTAATVGKEE